MRLWETEHPYYMSEHNYYRNNCHTNYESIKLFLDKFGGADIDRNLVIRWDWREGGVWDLADYNGSDTDRFARLLVHIMHQHKGYKTCHEIKVCRNDEPVARAYLEKHAKRIREIWEPLNLGSSPASTEERN